MTKHLQLFRAAVPVCLIGELVISHRRRSVIRVDRDGL